MNEPEWVTVKEAVEMFGVSKEKMADWMGQGTIRVQGMNGFLKVNAGDIDKILANEAKPTAKTTPREHEPKRSAGAPKGYVSATRAAKMLKVHEDTPRSWARAGTIESLRIGSRTYFPKDAIEARMNGRPGAAQAELLATEARTYNARQAAEAVGIDYQAMCAMLRNGGAKGKKIRGATGSPVWEISGAEVERLKADRIDIADPVAPVPSMSSAEIVDRFLEEKRRVHPEVVAWIRDQDDPGLVDRIVKSTPIGQVALMPPPTPCWAEENGLVNASHCSRDCAACGGRDPSRLLLDVVGRWEYADAARQMAEDERDRQKASAESAWEARMGAESANDALIAERDALAGQVAEATRALRVSEKDAREYQRIAKAEQVRANAERALAAEAVQHVAELRALLAAKDTPAEVSEVGGERRGGLLDFFRGKLSV